VRRQIGSRRHDVAAPEHADPRNVTSTGVAPPIAHEEPCGPGPRVPNGMQIELRDRATLPSSDQRDAAGKPEGDDRRFCDSGRGGVIDPQIHTRDLFVRA
jgi:hypothetical protein